MPTRSLITALLLTLAAALAGCAATTVSSTPTPTPAFAYRGQKVQRRAMSSSDMNAIRAQMAEAEAAAVRLTPRS